MNKKHVTMLVIAVAIIAFQIGGAYEVRLSVASNPVQAEAIFSDMEVKDPYLVLDDTWIDVREKPVLVLGQCPEAEALAELCAGIPFSKRPVLVYVTGDQPAPAYLTGLDYFTCKQGALPLPTLLTWGQYGLEGFSFNSLYDLMVDMQYPILLGQGQVFNNPDDPSGNNSMLAARQSNYVILQPGQEYRFYDYVAPSLEAGYQNGQSIFDNGSGGYMWGPDLGGGICKTATVLHYAVEDAGLTETSRGHHSLPVSYAVQGDDAAVSRSGGQDYCFVNNRSNPVVIVFNQQDDGILTAAIYEVLDNQTAKAEVQELAMKEPLIFDGPPLLLEVPKPVLDPAAPDKSAPLAMPGKSYANHSSTDI